MVHKNNRAAFPRRPRHSSPLEFIFLAGFCAILGLACGCATFTRTPGTNCARRVDFSAARGTGALDANARTLANGLYPEVCALLSDGKTKFPAHFDLSLKPIKTARTGETLFTEVVLNVDAAQRLNDDPGELKTVLAHELAHVAQHYWHPILGRWLMYDTSEPSYWTEGIADCCAFKICGGCAQCNALYPGYQNGYSCAAALILYVETNYCPRVLPMLNARLASGNFRDSFFKEITGKDLPELWAEFQRSPAYTPEARSMIELQQALGYVDGKPPKDIEKRIERHIDSLGNPLIRDMMKRLLSTPSQRLDIQTQLALIAYLTQPGGAPETCLAALREEGRLPGFAKGERPILHTWLTAKDLSAEYPARKTMTATRAGDPSDYHYTLERASQDTAWRLGRAWKTGPDGRVEEEYPVPAP